MKKRILCFILFFLLMTTFNSSLVFSLESDIQMRNIDMPPLRYSISDTETTHPISFIPFSMVTNSTKDYIYASDKDNKRIYSINLNTMDEKFIDLDSTPTEIYFKDNFLYVISSINDESGKITIINTNTFTILKDFSLDYSPNDIVVDNRKNILVSSKERIYSYAFLTCKLLTTTPSYWYNNLVITPDSSKLYTTNFYGDIYSFTNSLGYLTEFTKVSYRDALNKYKDTYISPDGKYIFAYDGLCLKTSSDVSTDLELCYKFNFNFNDMVFNIDDNKIYFATEDNIISIYSYDEFRFIGEFTLPNTSKFLFEHNNNLLSVYSDSENKFYISTIDKNNYVNAGDSHYPALVGNFIKPVYNPTTNKAYVIDNINKWTYVFDCDKQGFIDRFRLTFTPTTACVSDDGTKLYLLNDDETNLLTEINLEDYSSRTMQYTLPIDGAKKTPITSRRLYHKNNKIYINTNEISPKLFMFDATSFEEINYSAIGAYTSNGRISEAGEIAFTSDNKYMIVCHQYGNSPYAPVSYIDKYEIQNNKYVITDVFYSNINNHYIYRDSSDCPIIIDEVNNYFYYRDYKINLNNLSDATRSFINEFNNNFFYVAALNPMRTGFAYVRSLNDSGIYYIEDKLILNFPEEKYHPNLTPAFFSNDGIAYLYDKHYFKPVWPYYGDMNGDMKINITDLSLMSLGYNCKLEDDNYKSIYDLTGDYFIDIYDMCMLAKLIE